ncbi:MAG: Hpt domain-containing protein [Clostridia bacterium]|nr:Hpt domain-containing protein [Clostridia bacterium]
MTLQELYAAVGADYEQATRVLRMDKLIDKHIKKFPDGGVYEALIAARETMDPTALFETSHAMKGVCSNLGLVGLAALASEISEEFRPGNARRFTDDEVREKIGEIEVLYKKTAEAIRAYSASQM